MEGAAVLAAVDLVEEDSAAGAVDLEAAVRAEAGSCWL